MEENRLYNLRILGPDKTSESGIGYLAELYPEGFTGFVPALVKSGCKLPNHNTMIPIVAQMLFYRLGGYQEASALIPKGASEDSGISKGFEGRSLEIMVLPEGL